MTTGWRVLKMRLMPASTSWPRAWNSGPRWSMVGRSMARRTRSGTLVGPGICRKWRPAGMGIPPWLSASSPLRVIAAGRLFLPIMPQAAAGLHRRPV